MKLVDLAPEVTVDWSTAPIADEAWKILLQLGSPIGLEGEPSKGVTVGPVASDKLVAFLGVVRGPEATQWHFHSYPRPTSEPPASVAEATKKIGGVSGLYAQVISALGGDATTPAEFRIRAFLDAKVWDCLSIPGDPTPGDPALKLDSHAKVEQLGYRFSAGPIGLSEVAIVYLHHDHRFRLLCVANGLVAPAQDLTFTYVQDVLKLATDSFFRMRDGR